MQSVEHELETLEAAIEENSERMKVMREHLKNVQQEIKYTETRVGRHAIWLPPPPPPA